MVENNDVDAGTSRQRIAAKSCHLEFLWNRRRLFFLLSCAAICCIFVAEIAMHPNLAVSFRYKDRGEEDYEASENVTTRNQLYLEYLEVKEKFDKIIGTKRRKRLPDLIGIGVEKCGSGALRWMLAQHPMMYCSYPEETHFFGTSATQGGLESYINFMPAVADYEKAFEKTPAYFNFNTPSIPQSIRKNVPEAKVIVVLCDPVNRTFSDFVQEKKMKLLKKETKFEAFIYPLMKMISADLTNVAHNADATNAYIFNMLRKRRLTHILTTGLYYYHLTRWFKEYNETNFHIVDGDELMSNPGSAMTKVQEFLGIPKLIIPEDFVRGPTGFYCISMPMIIRTENGITLRKRNGPFCLGEGKSRTRMGRWKYQPSEAVVNSLRQFYAPYNKKLFSLLGRKFNWQRPA